MCILNSFTEVDILYLGFMEFKILFDFHKKVKTFENYLNTPLSFTLKKVFARCILHRPCYTVNFSSPLMDGSIIKHDGILGEIFPEIVWQKFL